MKIQSTLRSFILLTSLFPLAAMANALKNDWIEVKFAAKVQGTVSNQYKLDLMNAYFEKIKSRIPQRFQKKILAKKLQIIFQPELNRDAIFFPDADGKTSVIRVNAALFFHPHLHTLLAHEIFHAIHYILNPDEQVWIREGLAQYFEFIIDGKTNGLSVSHALDNIQTSLTSDYDIHLADRALYGHGLLYFHYVLDKCGGEDLFWKLADKGIKGIHQIDSILKTLSKNLPPACQDFESSYRHFELARVVNRVLYQYPWPDLYSAIPTSQKVKPSEKALANCQIRPFTPYYLTGKAFAESKLKIKDVEIFYIENRYPYRVETEGAKNVELWNVLLIPQVNFQSADSCQQ